MIELGYTNAQEAPIVAANGVAATAGGGTAGGGAVGAEQAASDPSVEQISATSADATNPESHLQYNARELANRLPAVQIYAAPCVWGDIAYWMDF